MDAGGRLVGLVTDGDVRRTIAGSTGTVRGPARAARSPSFMTRKPTCVAPEMLAFDALRTMETHQPRPVYAAAGGRRRGPSPSGMIHIHTLVQAGLTSGKDDA